MSNSATRVRGELRGRTERLSKGGSYNRFTENISFLRNLLAFGIIKTGNLVDEKHRQLVSLERGALIADIIGAVAVVISIIYLAYQVGENTDAVKVQTSHALLELEFQHAAWYQDIDHVKLMLKGNSNPSALSPAEWKKYSMDKTGKFNLWEQAHYGFRHGGVDEDQWESWDRNFVSILCNPGTLLFWETKQYAWGKPFQVHVTKYVAGCKTH